MNLLRLSAIALFAIAACGGNDDTPVDAGADDPAPVVGQQDPEYETTATVLESPGHGPQLCLGGVAESYPPQCGGPDIGGWDWADVEAESASGTTWGEFHVVGTFDGETFTLTEAPGLPDHSDAGRSRTFDTPCAEPAGGWAVVDESTATPAGQDAAIEYAQAQPEFAGVWVDQSVNPASDGEPNAESAMNDPTKLILNVRLTTDLDRHETELRERFGGALCVSAAERSAAELQGIQDELTSALDGMLFASTDSVRGVVEIGVVVADPAIQADLDQQYGEGVVELRGALRPVEG